MCGIINKWLAGLTRPSQIVGVRDNDMIEIDLGSKIIEVKRKTLCLAEGSLLSNLFSGGQCSDDLTLDRGK